MCRLVINPSGAWRFLSERSRYCQGVCHGFIPHLYRIDSLLLRCGALGILARRLRICGMIPSLREGQGCQSGGHASGLTIQLSQGQGRQLLVPKGAPRARGRAALKRSCVMASARHRTRGRCWCQPFCARGALPSVAYLGMPRREALTRLGKCTIAACLAISCEPHLFRSLLLGLHEAPRPDDVLRLANETDAPHRHGLGCPPLCLGTGRVNLALSTFDTRPALPQPASSRASLVRV